MRKLALRLGPPLALAGIAVALLAGGGDDTDRDGSTAHAARPQRPPLLPGAASKPRPPVVLLVFDEWPIDMNRTAAGRIDAVRYPNLAAFARRATWFPNATTVHDSTTKAIPAVLDGKLPRAGTRPTYLGHPETVFDLFGRHGYRVNDSEEATSICHPRWCAGADTRRPAILPSLQAGRRERLERFFRTVRAPRRPTLWVKHVLLPHGPYMFLPHGKQLRRGWQDPLPGMNSKPGFRERFLTLHNEQRVQLQLGFIDYELGRLFARMRREGIFDRALIALVADHGMSYDVGVKDRRAVTRRNIDEIAPVPFFLKAPRQRRGRIDRAYVRTIDLVPTIADVLNFRMPYRADGRSAYARSTRARRSVTMIRRKFNGTIRISGAELARRRATMLARRRRQFGSGDWTSLFTGIGPNRGLIGRPVNSIARAPAGRLRGRIEQAADLRAVRRSSLLRPIQVAGPMSGGRARERRDVAVAVNGRIEAVGRTFYLKGRPQESFAMLVPPGSLRFGRNSVQVFEVLGRGARLRPIAST